MRFLVALPTYNESDNVSDIIDAILKQDERLEVLVVDDNSPDGTAKIVKQKQQTLTRLHLLERPGKLGLGTAYLAAFAYALEQNFDAVIQMDADFSHPPEALRQFVKLLPDYELVVGSRYVEGGSIANWNWLRRTVSQMGNLYARFMLRAKMRELTGGFNGYRTDLLKRLQIDTLQSKSYAFQIELKLRALRLPARYKEFPITFIDRERGKSKIPRTQILTTLFKVTAWSLQR